MIAEEYLRTSRLFRRLKNGPHGQLVELYATLLVNDERASHGTWRCLNLVGGLLSWIERRGLRPTDLKEQVTERYLKDRAGKQSLQPGDRAALKRLLSALREVGMIAPAPLPPITPEDQIFEGFSDYLRQERGLAPRSIISHLPVVRRFLREGVPCGRRRSHQHQPRAGHPLHRAPRPGWKRGIWKADVLVAARISAIPPS